MIIKKDSEDYIQCLFFQNVKALALTDDRYNLVYSIPNGGFRSITTAKRMKATGLKAGVFDVNVDVPNQFFHGLKIEFKVGKNKLSEYQKEYMKLVESQGYKCIVCYSYTEALEKLALYFKNELF